jgi:hypothetical protein
MCNCSNRTPHQKMNGSEFYASIAADGPAQVGRILCICETVQDPSDRTLVIEPSYFGAVRMQSMIGSASIVLKETKLKSSVILHRLSGAPLLPTGASSYEHDTA